MIKRFAFVLAVTSCLLFAVSCQKGIMWASIGELKKGADNNCSPITVNGTYSYNQALTDSNYLVVTANITLPGTFDIHTDTVNGYFFAATGTFKTAGLVQVTLAGMGKPSTSGVTDFPVFYNESICGVAVTTTSDTLPVAVYSFQDNNKNCLADTVEGTYVNGVSVDTSSVVKVGVNVTTPGSYFIKTELVNGYSFSAGGTFINAGLQTVTLQASGIPKNAGTDIFPLTAGDVVCNFSVNVLSTVPVTNDDLFPLNIDNYWVYDDLRNPADSITRTITGTQTINDNPYYIMNEQRRSNAVQYLFRKNNNDYDEYTQIDKYTSSFQYNKIIDTTLNFLKTAAAGISSWESDEIKDTASFGQLIYLKYYFSFIKSNAVVAINGNAFGGVYEVLMQPQIKSELANYGSADPTYFFYYAKGIGLIYMSIINNGTVTGGMQIRRWHVN